MGYLSCPASTSGSKFGDKLPAEVREQRDALAKALRAKKTFQLIPKV